MAVTNNSYMGKGTIYMKDLSDAAAGFISIGNCSKLNFAVDSETKKQNDYMSAGGGVIARVDRINTVGCNITILNISAENLARAVNGTSSSVVAGTVSGTPESVTAILDSLLRLAHPNPTSVVVKNRARTLAFTSGGTTEITAGNVITGATSAATGTVVSVTVSTGTWAGGDAAGTLTITKQTGTFQSEELNVGSTTSVATVGGNSSAAPMTLVANTDYVVTAGGVTPLSTGDVVSGEVLDVTYSYGAYSAVQSLLESAKDYALFFEGLNDYNNKPVLIDAWKVRFGPGKDIGWIGDDYAEISIEGECLKDTTKGTGISEYYTAQMAV